MADLAQVGERAYLDGWADGKADNDPAPDRLALGANRLNDYERGYADSGHLPEPSPARPGRAK